MNSSPAEVIAEYLIEQAVLGDPEASSPMWPGYVGFVPDKPGLVPDDCGAVIDMEGVKDGRLMSGENIYHPGVQIVVRSVLQTRGWAKANEIARLLEIVHGEAVNVGFETYTMQNISQQSPIFYLGMEPGTRRYLHSINYLTTFTADGVLQLTGDGALRLTEKQSLVSGVAKTLLTVPLPAGGMKGGKIEYVVVCSDGTTNQVLSGKLAWVAENTSGTITGNVQVFADNPAMQATLGTLSIDGALDTSVANKVSVTITVTTSLTPTRFKIYYFPIGN